MDYIKWHKYLVPDGDDRDALFNYVSPSDTSIIIAQEIAPLVYRYARFKTVYDLAMYIKEKITSYEELCLYEVIPPNVKQKIFIDIDAERTQYIDDSDILDPLLKGTLIKKNKGYSLTIEQAEEALLLFVKRMKEVHPYINDDDIGIYSSHRINKISYHIIVDRWCYTNILDNKSSFDQIINDYDERYIKAIDAGIYNKNRLFRIYNCHKYGKNNTKILDKHSTWKSSVKDIDSEDEKWFDILRASLITNASYCNILISFNHKKVKEFTGDKHDLEENEIVEAINKYAAHLGFNSYTHPDFPFYLGSNDGNIISLKRKKSHYCHACCRVHDSIDQYLIVTIKNEVILCCYRSSNKFSLGFLYSHPQVEVEEEIVYKPLPKKINSNFVPMLSVLDKIDNINKTDNINNIEISPIDKLNNTVFNLPEKAMTVKQKIKIYGLDNIKLDNTESSNKSTYKPKKDKYDLLNRIKSQNDDYINIYMDFLGTDSFPFIPSNINNNTIELKCINPYYCHVCKSDHNNINQYLEIKSNGKIILGCYLTSDKLSIS